MEINLGARMTVQHPLLTLAADPSDAAREALVAATASQFLDSVVAPSAAEIALYCDVLAKLYSFARHEIRQRLSATLAMADWAPEDLLRELALDIIEIAQPIISLSPVLSDKILLEVVEKQDLAHRLCVAQRPCLAEDISHQLIKLDNLQILGAVVRNPTAQIKAKDFEEALSTLSDRPDDLDALILRHDLPPSLIATAYSLAGTQARMALSVRLPPNLQQRLSRVTAFVAADAADGYSAAPLVTRLHTKIQSDVRSGNRRSTPGSIIARLMRGEHDVFCESIAALLGLPHAYIENLLSTLEPYTIALIARACGFDITIARTIFETLDTAGHSWTLADDKMVALLWMRSSTAAARLQLASSVPAELAETPQQLH
jgi:uncharacterized protein (DUF2336 family)